MYIDAVLTTVDYSKPTIKHSQCPRQQDGQFFVGVLQILKLHNKKWYTQAVDKIFQSKLLYN